MSGSPPSTSSSDRLLIVWRYRRSEQQRWRTLITILSKLSLTDKAHVSAVPTPEARVRSKMIEAIDTQIEAATAKSNGEVYIRRAKRWVDDPESGERVLKEMPVRFRPWCWTDENGTVFLEVRYGKKRLELQPGNRQLRLARRTTCCRR